MHPMGVYLLTLVLACGDHPCPLSPATVTMQWLPSEQDCGPAVMEFARHHTVVSHYYLCGDCAHYRHLWTLHNLFSNEHVLVELACGTLTAMPQTPDTSPTPAQ